MSAETLEEALAAITPGRDPNGWAFAAYRAAVARSETATGEGDVRRALDLLDRASRILTATRSPIEHARILTATANCHRQLGLPASAADLFDQAVELLVGRSGPSEQAAALINQGLACVETGRAPDAIGPLGRAIDLVADSPDDEDRRVHGAALVNRAQAQQVIGTVESLRAAANDYDAASHVLDEESPQRGMALHGLGATIMELLALGDSDGAYDDAVAVFTASLRVLTANAFPFQHAVAQHSLAIAHERRGALLDLERALNHIEIALSMFDPRLHPSHWQTAAEALGRLDTRLAEVRQDATRADHFVALVAGVDESARTVLLRDRLVPLSGQPGERIRRDLDGLMSALAALAASEYDIVVRSMLPLLMELPEIMLSAACAGLCAAHQATDQASAYDAILDGVVHDLLHGPQRVRVRDMLDAQGWIRP
jgi:tetratricopeptide (TPR) repeat protein